ncbi:MAG: thiamine-phosphate kinase [Candidatus Thioglobus sp.]|jgi:thiamine-monophosphate kinase|nr:thiamine-phosphate kinase [Candidatus Thioglobus sp.]|tara:strand:+ start:5586 stop:6518 length:933 start_codon:yes stop_codon:yes gene_type:complete
MNEFDLIREYFSWPSEDSDVVLGVGDDAAVVNVPTDQQLVMSTDTLIEGVHFSAQADPRDIAHKALAVNLSDIAAMGGQAKCFTLALSLPEIDKRWLGEFSSSLNELAGRYQVSLVGGDTTRGALSITINVIGLVESGSALKRSGASPGDGIYVSNTIGSAAYAWWQLNNDQKPSEENLERLHRPTPQLELGRALNGLASACIDISDGLEQDLGHILDCSNVGAIIELEDLPLDEELSDHVKRTSDYSIALCGGDDYELCFSMPKKRREWLLKRTRELNVRTTRIGEITKSLGMEIKGYSNNSSSYQHFK